MTPEPKARASDLDAAVGRLAWTADVYEDEQMIADVKAVRAALSSQSQAAEGMAKALEPFSEIAGRYLTGGLSSDLRSRAPDLIKHFDARSFYAARTALSHYRTLGDRHVD